ncbi:MAG TPA: hypothetical protein VFA63_15580 [Pseudonocardiaceae bacterium]|nr:hypothetical protein [Pseudonocardiaceae bacterium]
MKPFIQIRSFRPRFHDLAAEPLDEPVYSSHGGVLSPLIRAPKHRLLDLAVTAARLGIGLAPAWRFLTLKDGALAGRWRPACDVGTSHVAAIGE